MTKNTKTIIVNSNRNADDKENHNNQKKIAVINDFSGFGKCSIAVALPIISAMKVQCCPLPTSIFSNHTGFDEFFFHDYTEYMPEYMSNWKKLDLEFEGIASGFLGSKGQIEVVKNFISLFRTEKTKIIVDPVMGDYGERYPIYTDDMCSMMRDLVDCADIITPNLTESCIITGHKYHDGSWSLAELKELAHRFDDFGTKNVIITGIRQKGYIANLLYTKGPENPGNSSQASEIRYVKTKRVGIDRSGTGDIFSAIIAADVVNGVPLFESVKKASKFVQNCLVITEEMNIPKTDGLCFEEILTKLR